VASGYCLSGLGWHAAPCHDLASNGTVSQDCRVKPADNPAIIQVGATYTDLGATITGPRADLNLGITTYVNGTPMNPVQLDTTQAATDTIQYVATNQSRLTSTSTRTVIVEPATAPSIVPTDDASTTTATSSAQ
jgi:hypothetical protein